MHPAVMDLIDLEEKTIDAQVLDSMAVSQRKKEVSATHNNEMLRQSLEDEISFAYQEMEDAKKGSAASAEKKCTADGDLQATSQELASDAATKETLHCDCMTVAAEFQATTKSRVDELKVLTEAGKVFKEATGGSALAQVPFLEVARSCVSSGEDLANLNAVRFLARRQHSTTLAQLASSMASDMRAGGVDPFLKVKGLITGMIAKLEAEAGTDATKKAFCDKDWKMGRETGGKMSACSCESNSNGCKGVGWRLLVCSTSDL